MRLPRSPGDPAVRFTFFALVALVVLYPILAQGGGMNLFHDAQFLSAYERHARLSVLGYGELPLWDPYSCGGMYGLAAPQTRYVSPFFLLSLLFGVDRASPLILFVSAIIGMEGTFRYARDRGARLLPAMLFAPLAACHGYYAFSFHFGWVQFASFQFFPWLLLGLRRALRGEVKGVIMLAVSTALLMGVGGTYTLPMSLIPMSVEAFAAMVPSKAQKKHPAARAKMKRVAYGALAALLLTVLVGAYRLFPMLEAAPSTLRVMGGTPSHDLRTILAYLFGYPDHIVGVPGQYYVGIGAVVALTALVARRTCALWLMLGITLALSFGQFAPAAPFSLLRALPVYETLRYPERNLVFVCFLCAVLASVGASSVIARMRLRRRSPRAIRIVTAIACILAIVSVFDLRYTTSQWARFTDLTASPVERIAPFRQARGSRWIASHYVETGLGVLSCGEAYPVPMSIHLRGNLPHEEYLVEPSHGTVRRVRWSPHRIELDVTLTEASRLRVNQNYHLSWKSTVGRVVSDDGLLAVDLPRGRHRVVLAFRPSSALFGALATIAGLVVAVVIARKSRAVGVQTLAFIGAPLLAFMLLEGVLGDGIPKRLEPLARDGERVVLDALPRTATPLDVRFDTGLALVGYEPFRMISSARAEVSLFWKRTGRVSANIGVFLHVFGDSRTTADHPELSSVVYPSRAPIGKVIRDTLEVELPAPDATGAHSLRVGLWNAYGDWSRVRITNAHGARVERNAVVLPMH